MSDFLLVQGVSASTANRVCQSWKAGRKWVRSVAVRDRWEPGQLEINGRDAVAFMKGKHKTDLAELVVLLQTHGGRVVHLMLHRSQAERREQDLGDWARRLSSASTG